MKQKPIQDPAIKIMTIVCDHFQMNIHELKTASRKRIYALPRQVCIYFIREFEVLSWHTIKLYFNQNHANCIYGYNAITNYIKTDRSFANEITEMKNKIMQVLNKGTVIREKMQIVKQDKAIKRESTNPIRIDWNKVAEQKIKDYEFKRHFMKDVVI